MPLPVVADQSAWMAESPRISPAYGLPEPICAAAVFAYKIQRSHFVASARRHAAAIFGFP
jgi:hypothetical protein